MKVSILMITYNHEKFIAQAIDSVLEQKANFDYEIVIGEDCSADNTRYIVEEYAGKHPNRIKPVFNKKNLGPAINFDRTLHACKGQYIALLEGDDYWTSPHKLQKQVDFLDKHPECSMCFHDSEMLIGGRVKKYPTPSLSRQGFGTLKDVLERFVAASSSLMFRGGLYDKPPEWYYKTAIGTIWGLYILHASYGKIGYIKETMSIYRVHKKGVWSGLSPIAKCLEIIKFYKVLRGNMGSESDDIIDKNLSLILAEYYGRNARSLKAFKQLFMYCLLVWHRTNIGRFVYVFLIILTAAPAVLLPQSAKKKYLKKLSENLFV